MMSVENGCLVNDTEIHLRLHSNPITFWKSQQADHEYSVKCLAVDYHSVNQTSLENGEDPDDNTQVLVSNYCEDDCKPRTQDSNGAVYSKDDYVVFRTRLPDTNSLGFQFDIFQHDSKRLPCLIGSAHLLPLLEDKSKFSQRLPIIGVTNGPIGTLTVEILVVRPMPDVTITPDDSFFSYWTRNQQGLKALDIGHRGFGESYSVGNHKKENTLASFKEAADHGADCVEFDVVMTKDFHPVVFHDFSVKIACANEKSIDIEQDLHEIPIKELSLRQLQSLKLYSGGSSPVKITDKTKDDNHSIAFPTLVSCLQEADERLSFDIEVKYPQRFETGEAEADDIFDMNFFVDQILKVIFEHAGSRKIVFTSFEPDICCLLRLKQCKYPVIFLTQGGSIIYQPFLDFRSISFNNAINFCVADKILGVSLLSEVLLRDMDAIRRAKEKKLTVFVWGGDNNNADMIKQLRCSNVDGIIYDRMDCHKPEHQLKFLSSEQNIPSLAS